MSEDKQFKHESVQDCATVLKYLKALIEGFERGQLTLASGNQTLCLEPKGLLTLTVEAKRKGDRSKLAIKCVWKHEEVEEPVEEVLSIKADLC